jgi:UDP-N-acetylglucosamine--N-acetylmuramyl-(pentapeptide) pyrophosphoryl-undecaprenol N-acetylglucosamine transferase
MTADKKGGHSILLAAGGTGGHVFPAIAVAEELMKRGHTVALATDARGTNLGNSLPGVDVHRISASGVRGGIVAKISGVLSIGLGVLQARGLFRKIRPDCVIGFGGYPSVPTMVAAASRGLPTIIHEQNAVLGRANRLVSKRVSVIASSFEHTSGIDDASEDKVVMTGNPVRAAFTTARAQAYPPIGRNGEGVKILVLGGSQGARILSEIIPQAVREMPETLRRRFAITQQCRPEDLENVRAIYTAAGLTAELSTFFNDVPDRMAAAHVVITRAGASTVAELAEAGRPAILIPYLHATDDHQTANARAVEEKGAGWLIPQAGFTPETLTMRLESFVNLQNLLTDAARAAHGFGGQNAAAALADQAERLMGITRNGGSGPGTAAVREIAA